MLRVCACAPVHVCRCSLCPMHSMSLILRILITYRGIVFHYFGMHRRHLEAARLEYSQPLSLQEVEARLSESQLQRLTSFSDGSECLAELERMHQELQVVVRTSMHPNCWCLSV